MASEIIDCEEFSEISVRASALLIGGELTIDSRIIGRGYLNISLKGGQVVFRADRYVGIIPVTDGVSIRVRPRASISDLSYMIARSGVAPVAIPSFSRGYLPRFEVSDDVDKIYGESLVQASERLVERGLMKGYVDDPNPPKWRGRLLVSDTVRQHLSRGIRYKHEFLHSNLSYALVENIAIKAALNRLTALVKARGGPAPLLPRIKKVLGKLSYVPHWHDTDALLVSQLGRRIAHLPAELGYYRDPLWMALLVLQSSLPDISSDGSVAIDSLIIDVSKVFEAYTRRVLFDRAPHHGLSVQDGNLRPSTFFVDNSNYIVKPDIVISRNDRPLIVLDAKYKLNPKESDRYELLSFMDAVGVDVGGFICPTIVDSPSAYIGTTPGGKAMTVLRFDLSAPDPDIEADRLFENVLRLTEGVKRFS